MPALQPLASEPYAALKQSIWLVVWNTIGQHNERAGLPTPRQISADLAAEIADAVVTRVLEMEKKPKEWDAADAMRKVYISSVPTNAAWDRNAAISFFHDIAPRLAEAALSAEVPEPYRA